MVMSSTSNGTSYPDAEKFNNQSKERDSESGYDYDACPDEDRGSEIV